MQPVYAVAVDREECIGSADCVYVAPDVFHLDEERKAVADTVAAAAADDALLWQAADRCPVLAILLYDEEGNEIFPPW